MARHRRTTPAHAGRELTTATDIGGTDSSHTTLGDHDETTTVSTASGRPWARRALAGVAVLAIVAAAIGVPIIAPQPTPGSHSILAIARADCPPDCGTGGGDGTNGPPGGGTEFVPPSVPAGPTAAPNNNLPPLDQNNGININNTTAAPQPSQAAQPSQPPTQNSDGSYTRAANGEQQPNQYSQAPDNQQPSNDWQQLQNQLNNQPGQQGQQSGQDASQSQENSQDSKRHRCEEALAKRDQLEQIERNTQWSQDNFPAFFLQIVQNSGDLATKCDMPAGGRGTQDCVPVEGSQQLMYNEQNVVTAKENGSVDKTGQIFVRARYDRATGLVYVTGQLQTVFGFAYFPPSAAWGQAYVTGHLRPGDAVAINVAFSGSGIVGSSQTRYVDIEVCDRTQDGKFAGGSGYAKDSENIGLAKFLIENHDWYLVVDDYRDHPLAKLDSPTINTAGGRYFDGIVCRIDDPSVCMGLEVKSGGAQKSARQSEFDDAVSATNPARATYTVNDRLRVLVVTSVAPTIYVP